VIAAELNGNWTTHGCTNSRTGHLTDWSTHRLDISWRIRELSSPTEWPSMFASITVLTLITQTVLQSRMAVQESS